MFVLDTALPENHGETEDYGGGGGDVGGTTAQRLAEKNEYEVVLVDIAESSRKQGSRYHTGRPVFGYSTRVVGTNGYDETPLVGCVITSEFLASRG